MEEKLKELKRVMQIEKEKRESDMQNSGSRWKAAEVSKSRPLKNYSSKLIEDKN